MKTKEKQVWKLSSDLKSFNMTEYDMNDKEISTSYLVSFSFNNKYRYSGLTLFLIGQIDVDSIKDVRKEEIKFRQMLQLFSICIACKRLDNEQVEQTYIFGSQNEVLIDFWLDSINLLRSKPNPNITCFVECLIDTQLLDLHTLGVEIPHLLPKCPELPLNFEFQYKV